MEKNIKNIYKWDRTFCRGCQKFEEITSKVLSSSDSIFDAIDDVEAICRNCHKTCIKNVTNYINDEGKI